MFVSTPYPSMVGPRSVGGAEGVEVWGGQKFVGGVCNSRLRAVRRWRAEGGIHGLGCTAMVGRRVSRFGVGRRWRAEGATVGVQSWGGLDFAEGGCGGSGWTDLGGRRVCMFGVDSILRTEDVIQGWGGYRGWRADGVKVWGGYRTLRAEGVQVGVDSPARPEGVEVWGGQPWTGGGCGGLGWTA